MITEERSSLGLKIQFPRPGSVDEYNESAKRTDGKNACLEDAVDQNYAHVWLSDFRELFLHGRAETKDAEGKVVVSRIVGVEEQSGIPRKTKVTTLKSKDAAGNFETREDWDESQGTYFDRVLATKGQKPEDWQALASEVAAQIPFDASVSERKPAGPKKLPKTYEAAAAAVIEQGGFATAVTKIATATGLAPISPTGDKAKDIESLGWYIKSWKDLENKKLASQLLA